MEEKIIFETLDQQSRLFFKGLGLNYSLKKNLVESNYKIKGSFYTSYKQLWISSNFNIEVKFNITSYIDSDSKPLINIYIYNYEKLRSLNVYDYFLIKKNIQMLKLEDYKGNTIQEKIESFFKWLHENLDEKLINILKGVDWVEIPFDWHGYK